MEEIINYQGKKLKVIEVIENKEDEEITEKKELTTTQKNTIQAFTISGITVFIVYNYMNLFNVEWYWFIPLFFICAGAGMNTLNKNSAFQKIADSKEE